MGYCTGVGPKSHGPSLVKQGLLTDFTEWTENVWCDPEGSKSKSVMNLGQINDVLKKQVHHGERKNIGVVLSCSW